MKIKPLYLRSLAVIPLEREEFLLHLERALAFFASLYGRCGMRDPNAASEADPAASAPLSIDGECAVSELWSEALLLYMEYLCKGERELYTRALSAAEGAYRTLWRVRAAGRRLRPR